MKRSTLLSFLFFCCFAGALAQLPPVAQALYDEAYNSNPVKGQIAINAGAQFIATPDGNTFYLKWFPSGSTPSNSPLIVTLHGSASYVFDEFAAWDSLAQLHGCGIIALQWYKGVTTSPPNDYFNETEIYSYIDSALTKIGYPSGKALLHGFSRGSARSYAVIFKDNHGGKNYFCTTISNAGGVDTSYQLYNQIHHLNFGNNVFSGKRWAMFCGGQDPNPNQSGCPSMSFSKSWLEGFGATIDLFIQDPNLAHGGFHLTPAYVDSVLVYYLQCYNGALGTNEINNAGLVSVFPNPSGGMFSIQSSLSGGMQLNVYDIYGTRIKQENLNTESTSLDISSAASGIYFLHIKGADGTMEFRKLVKE